MIFWSLIIGFFVILWLFRINRDYYVLSFFAKRFKTTDGSPVEVLAPTPKQKTIFGNAFDIFGMTSVETFAALRECAQTLKKSYIQYTFAIGIYNIVTPEDAEIILTNQDFLTKGFAYKFLHPFLRLGLLTSTDKKWHSRRKMLTPAFHFNILEQFEETFKQESRKFVKNLENMDCDVLCLLEPISKFTLNTVCETALGVQLDNRLDGNEYRSSFKMIEDSFVKRLANPWYLNDTLFNLFAASQYEKHLRNVHDFSSEIIQKRRQLFEKESKELNPEKEDEGFFMKKRRYAMLDTLLMAEKKGLIDHLGICEEVDTFMFEGFDTTSMGLIFSLMNLSLYPEMQERCFKEISDNIEDDLDKLDIAQLSKLKYLECFIKETLRLYPSVPIIGRQASKETVLANKLILPKNTQVSIHIFDIHRNPKHFPEPNKFDPERFLPENSLGRHPYAYLPFSAGQRNCIGQKFAMLEIKTLLVHILKNFQILPLTDPKEFRFEVGIIIRTQKDIKIKFVKRELI